MTRLFLPQRALCVGFSFGLNDERAFDDFCECQNGFFVMGLENMDDIFEQAAVGAAFAARVVEVEKLGERDAEYFGEVIGCFNAGAAVAAFDV